MNTYEDGTFSNLDLSRHYTQLMESLFYPGMIRIIKTINKWGVLTIQADITRIIHMTINNYIEETSNSVIEQTNESGSRYKGFFCFFG
jgi:hypothetical protein